jgi:arginyl-tRNA synthetase
MALLAATAQVLKNALAVLGVNAPERMDRDTPSSAAKTLTT